MRAFLTIQTRLDEPHVCELSPDQANSIGRNRKNTIVLHDERASRFHAEIVYEEGRWFLRDCDTLNGTRLEGVRLEERVALADGQVITIGNSRLRFSLGLQAPVTPLPTATLGGRAKEQAVAGGAEQSQTALDVNELTALCQFMARCVSENEGRTVIELALETVHRQTRACFAGFLSLDPEEPFSKMVFPALAQVDVHLSRQLTHEVQGTGRTVWLKASAATDVESESLSLYRDALCLPVCDGEASFGALHVYKSTQVFTGEDFQFCEAVAGFLAGILGRIRLRRRLEAENLRLRVHSPTADELIGDSPAIRQLREQIARLVQRAGPRPSPVLVRGESGSGKELVALALHRQSTRRDGPLVVVNCAAISPNLLEGELFGYRKGAFSGADRDHPGLFQQADEGTLFLDEVGELSLECQAKLLRVLERKGFRPLGATAEVQTDVRIIAATHRPLEDQVKAGKFREDLYYRLAGISIPVPPLRDHVEDIPDLVDYFLQRLGAECGQYVRLTPAAMCRLQEYSWPGNVRQLRSVLENAVMFSDKKLLEPADLPLPAPSAEEQPATGDLEQAEIRALRDALRRSGGNISQAARILDIGRDTLAKKIKRYGISKEG